MKKTRNVSLISQWVVQPGHSLSRAECHISRGVFLSLGRRRLTDRIEKHTTSGVNSISLYIYTTTIHKQRIGLKIHEKKDEKKNGEEEEIHFSDRWRVPSSICLFGSSHPPPITNDIQILFTIYILNK